MTATRQDLATTDRRADQQQRHAELAPGRAKAHRICACTVTSAPFGSSAISSAGRQSGLAMPPAASSRRKLVRVGAGPRSGPGFTRSSSDRAPRGLGAAG
jgi:hypothetical protein